MSTRSSALLAVVAVAITAAVVAFLVLRSPGGDEPDAGYRSRTLESVDTTVIAVDRGPLCQGVADEAVAEALGREPVKTKAYDNGDLTRLTSQVRDIAHEFGCAWRAPKATAQTWVFAPPVTRERARRLARQPKRGDGCAPIAEAPAFGRPSSGVVCRAKGESSASFQGLFGDAWLTCRLTVRGPVQPAQLENRTGRWCAGVLSQF